MDREAPHPAAWGPLAAHSVKTQVRHLKPCPHSLGGERFEVVRILAGAVTQHSHLFLWVTLSHNHKADV